MNLQFIGDFANNYFSQFKFFLDGNYYSGVFQKYFSLPAFIGGAVIAIAIFIMWVYVDNDGIGLRHMIIGLVAVEISPIIIKMINNTIGNTFSTQVFEQYMNPVNNIISGIVLVLIMYSTYKFDKKISFGMGCIIYLMPLLLNANYYFTDLGNKNIIFAVIQFLSGALAMGLFCVLFCKRKYFYSAWILYFVFHIVSRCLIIVLNVWILNDFTFIEVVEGFLKFVLAHYTNIIPDIIIFGIVLLVSILYERTVFKELKEQRVLIGE